MLKLSGFFEMACDLTGISVSFVSPPVCFEEGDACRRSAICWQSPEALELTHCRAFEGDLLSKSICLSAKVSPFSLVIAFFLEKKCGIPQLNAVDETL